MELWNLEIMELWSNIMMEYGINAGNGWNDWKWLEMAGKGWKWLDMYGMAGNGWKWLILAGMAEMPAMAENGYNCWKWQEMARMAGNCKKLLKCQKCNKKNAEMLNCWHAEILKY